MNRFQQKAIEMKYEGYTYQEIARAMGGLVSRHTIEMWFRHDGILYIPYQHYVVKMQQIGEKEAREKIKKSGYAGADVLDELLTQAMQSGDLQLAFQIVVKQLAISGIVEEKKLRVIEEKHYDTTDELIAELKAQGIDPLTGLTERAAQLLSAGKIKN